MIAVASELEDLGATSTSFFLPNKSTIKLDFNQSDPAKESIRNEHLL
jgi:hypothetical protein